jgi:ADP-ribosyl-[dinitrogen reductase] hydrolase
MGSTMRLTSAQRDRAIGVLLGTAAGDALGAGYEFGPPLPDAQPVQMNGGGSFGWAPGEWTDDTSMAIPLAEAAARSDDLREDGALDVVVEAWARWALTSKDVGIQTSQVLRGSGSQTAAALRESARAVHEQTGRSGGNGSLMRTAPLALAYLDDADALAEAARKVSALTHHDPEAGEACVLWCLAIRHAVLHGTFDGLRAALEVLPPGRGAVWAQRLDEAEAKPPRAFDQNGWVVQALQGAWSAISRTPVPTDDPAADSVPSHHLRLALEAAVRGGRDTDTVAAIAGGLLGGRWGSTAVPASWRRILHGWPEYRSRDLVRLAMHAVDPHTRSGSAWPVGSGPELLDGE